LRVIAAGVGDDTASAVLIGKRSDLVIRSAQFESADGLLVFRFEEEAASAVFSQGEFDQLCTNRDAVERRLRGVDVGYPGQSHRIVTTAVFRECSLRTMIDEIRLNPCGSAAD